MNVLLIVVVYSFITLKRHKFDLERVLGIFTYFFHMLKFRLLGEYFCVVKTTQIFVQCSGRTHVGT